MCRPLVSPFGGGRTRHSDCRGGIAVPFRENRKATEQNPDNPFWDDERSLAILKNVRKAMSPGSRLLVIKAVIDPATASGAPGKLMDLNMLVMTGGQERTAEEYGALYRASGFELARVLPLPGGLAVFEGKPV